MYEALRFVYSARNKIIHEGKGSYDEITISYKKQNKRTGKSESVNKTWKIHWGLTHDGLTELKKFIRWLS